MRKKVADELCIIEVLMYSAFLTSLLPKKQGNKNNLESLLA